MLLVVEVTEKAFELANWDGMNRQQVAKHLRETLEKSNADYHGDDWRRRIFEGVQVKALPNDIMDAIRQIKEAV